MSKPNPLFANKVLVTTTYSSDGRSRETLLLPYPHSGLDLFLLELILKNSTAVVDYYVYDANGMRIPFTKTDFLSKYETETVPS